MNSNLKLLSAGLLVAVLALAGCGGGGSDDTMAPEPMPTPEEQCTADGGTYVDGNCMSAEQVAAEGAIAAANMAALALDNTSDATAVNAVAALIAAAETAIAALPADDQAAETAKLTASKAVVDAQNARLQAEADRQAAQDEADRVAQEEADRKAAEAAAAAEKAAEDARKMAAKLYGLISVGGTPPVSAAGNPTTAGSGFMKGAVADALGSWMGQHYDRTDQSALVYSKTGKSTMGAKFSAFAAETGSGLTAITTGTQAGEFTIAPADLDAAYVMIDGYSRTSGEEEYEPMAGRTRVELSGALRGVSGTYYCTPENADTNCGATVAGADGQLTLGGGTWTFRPGSADSRVTETPGSTYSFGWWLNESTDPSTVSVFMNATAADGTALTATIPATTRGTATYEGKAAGKYALNHGVGGPNDSGHFTADAMLSASFGTGDSAAHEISGMIDEFKGADGEDRDWSVSLGTNVLTADGTVTAAVSDGDAANGDESLTTVWTIDGVKAAAAGSWDGALYGSDGGVPTAATGMFSAGYNNVGKMIGAFGAEKE